MRTAVKSISAIALLVAGLVTVPAQAQADPSTGRCDVGIVLPSKLVLTGYTTQYGVRLTGDTECFAYVGWDLSIGLISTGQTVSFYGGDTSGFKTYLGGPAKVHALPRAGSYSFTQYVDPLTGEKRTYQVVETGSGTMTAKYDSRISWHAPKRSGRRATLSASVASISDATRFTGTYAAWSGEKVRFQRKHGLRWLTVAVARADAHGVARVGTKFKKGVWRAVSVDDATTWGRQTGSHKL